MDGDPKCTSSSAMAEGPCDALVSIDYEPWTYRVALFA